MPSTPGTVNFPTAFDDAVSLIEAPLLPAQTTLAADVSNGATSIPLTSAANFSASGVAMLLDSLTAPTVIEKVVYTSISGGALVVPTGGRGKFGTSAATWTAGAIVAQIIGGESHGVLASALLAIETKIGTGNTSPSINQALLSNGVGASTWAPITNAHIIANAAIAYSKLNLTDRITDADISGVAAIGYAKLNLADGIVNADISSSAAIGWTKISKAGASLADLTTRSATALNSGTLDDARLSANVVLIDGSRSFTSPVSGIAPTASAHLATKGYADSLVVGLLDDRGNYDASSNTFPASGGSGSAGAILKGDLWTVSVAGTLGGTAVTPGDIVRALVNTPGQTAGNWAVSETNIGYTTLNAALSDGQIYIGNSSNIGTARTLTGDVTVSNTGVTAIGNTKVTNAMLAGSIAFSKLVGSDVMIAESQVANLVGDLAGKQSTLTNSAGLAAALSDKTGFSSGALAVFSKSPAIETPSITTGFTIGGAAAGDKIIRGDGTNFIASSFTMAAPGASGNMLTSDGTNWVSSAPSGGGGSPGGSNKQIQFNNSSAFGGATGFEYQSGASPNISITAQAASHTALYVNSTSSPTVAPFRVALNGTDAMALEIDGFLSFAHTKGIKGNGGGQVLTVHGGPSGSIFIVGQQGVTIQGNTGVNVFSLLNRDVIQITTATVTEAGYPLFSVAGAWNASGVVHDGIKLRVTNTASAAQSKLLDLGLTSSLFTVNKDGVVDLFNGAAPTASVTDGVRLYAEDVSSSSELKVRDEAGNVTTLSPHNFSRIPGGATELMAWAYYSERDDQFINVDMLKLARVLEKLSGEKLVYTGKRSNNGV